MSAVLSTATISAVGLLCKAFLNSGLCSVEVNGLQTLRNALENSKRNTGQGIVTVCNHISTLDDPVVWGVLPARYYFSSRTTRWALGASDIMFTNPVFSAFFTLGQTLETFRGNGIYQDAVNTAIQKIDQGGWVHLYGEGKVNQPNTYTLDKQGRACLPRFKWGIGRILMEANIPPVVIPMWLTGFDQLMPEGRSFPYNYFPRIGARLSVTFGDPIPADEILEALDVSRTDPDVDDSEDVPDTPDQLKGWLGDQATKKHDATGRVCNDEDHLYASLIRQKVTAILHHDVEALGRSVSGNLLGGTPRDA
ncbi:acyltransferase-domain-containing protein [Flammula alnicola]|nr:acyltransferase-domain-containing protein [Flammula alnicola]